MSLKNLESDGERERARASKGKEWERERTGEQEGEGAQRVRERMWEKGASECKPLRVLPFLRHPYQLCATEPRGPQATAAQVRWCHTATRTVSLKPKLGQKHLLWLTEAASQHLPHLSKSLRTPSLSFCQKSHCQISKVSIWILHFRRNFLHVG